MLPAVITYMEGIVSGRMWMEKWPERLWTGGCGLEELL